MDTPREALIKAAIARNLLPDDIGAKRRILAPYQSVVDTDQPERPLMNDSLTSTTKYLPVRLDTTDPKADEGPIYWQATRDGDFLGLFDDDGDQVHIGNASWSVVSTLEDVVPPFAD